MNVGTTIIKCRHSVRKYKDTPVEECVIRDALECAHLAPTARNEQPWLFGTITDKDLRSKIAALADNGCGGHGDEEIEVWAGHLWIASPRWQTVRSSLTRRAKVSLRPETVQSQMRLCPRSMPRPPS